MSYSSEQRYRGNKTREIVREANPRGANNEGVAALCDDDQQSVVQRMIYQRSKASRATAVIKYLSAKIMVPMKTAFPKPDAFACHRWALLSMLSSERTYTWQPPEQKATKKNSYSKTESCLIDIQKQILLYMEPPVFVAV